MPAFSRRLWADLRWYLRGCPAMRTSCAVPALAPFPDLDASTHPGAEECDPHTAYRWCPLTGTWHDPRGRGATSAGEPLVAQYSGGWTRSHRFVGQPAPLSRTP